MKSKRKSLTPPETLPSISPAPNRDELLRELFAAHSADIDGQPPDATKGEWTIRDYMRANGRSYGSARKTIAKLMRAKAIELQRLYRTRKIYRFTNGKTQ